MQDRIAQILGHAKANAPSEVPADLQAECDAEEKVPTLMDHVIALRQEVAEMREELHAATQVTDAVGQAVGRLFAQCHSK